MRLVLQGVGDRFDSFFDRRWAVDEPRQTKLVFIGQDLNREQILASIAIDEALSTAELVSTKG